MDDASCDAPRSSTDVPGDATPTRQDAITQLHAELAALRAELHHLATRDTIRARLFEFVDVNGAVRVRVGDLGEEDVVGIECRRRNGSLSAFFGQVAGEGSLMFTGGSYDTFVVDFGATESGGHLRVVDPLDPHGERLVDVLASARSGPFSST